MSCLYKITGSKRCDAPTTRERIFCVAHNKQLEESRSVAAVATVTQGYTGFYLKKPFVDAALLLDELKTVPANRKNIPEMSVFDKAGRLVTL